MNSGTGNYSNIEEMNKVFSRKISLVRKTLELRHMEDEDARKFRSVEEEISELRSIFQEIRDEIKAGEEKLAGLQNLLKKLEALNKHLDNVNKNLPPALKQAAEKENKSACGNVKVVPAASVAVKSSKDPAKIQYVTAEEFKSVPDYMKGRMKCEQLNKFVSEFNTAIEGKYKILLMPRKDIKPAMLKIYQKLKSEENADTKGLYFCTADDLKEYGKIKVDKMSNNKLTILRHCRKMKEIRGPGPIVRYTVIC